VREKVDRDQIDTSHFQGWIDWAKSLGISMDFNPACFAHPKASVWFTLAQGDKDINNDSLAKIEPMFCLGKHLLTP
jgi:L-rhamnose isomerase